jgi:hypothetical protein
MKSAKKLSTYSSFYAFTPPPNREYIYPYSNLIIASGHWPRKTDLPGASKLAADCFHHDPVLFPMEDS